jgi:hypothetical protein
VERVRVKDRSYCPDRPSVRLFNGLETDDRLGRTVRGSSGSDSTDRLSLWNFKIGEGGRRVYVGATCKEARDVRCEIFRRSWQKRLCAPI